MDHKNNSGHRMLSNFAVQDLVFVVQGYSEDCRLFWGGEIFSWRHSCVPEHFVAGWAMELILAEIAREKKKRHSLSLHIEILYLASFSCSLPQEQTMARVIVLGAGF